MGRDLWMSLRSLRRAPGFALAAILTLGVALGAVKTAFGLLYGSLDDRRWWSPICPHAGPPASIQFAN